MWFYIHNSSNGTGLIPIGSYFFQLWDLKPISLRIESHLSCVFWFPINPMGSLLWLFFVNYLTTLWQPNMAMWNSSLSSWRGQLPYMQLSTEQPPDATAGHGMGFLAMVQLIESKPEKLRCFWLDGQCSQPDCTIAAIKFLLVKYYSVLDKFFSFHQSVKNSSKFRSYIIILYSHCKTIKPYIISDSSQWMGWYSSINMRWSPL